jgi:hypothetical protein
MEVRTDLGLLSLAAPCLAPTTVYNRASRRSAALGRGMLEQEW